ncbi:MAG: GNAT family N-acetyltransferase [Bryobacteraceae bacterium]
MLSNPFWSALRTEHSQFAIGEGPVLRYPADLIPFAGLDNPSVEHFKALRDLLAPDETIFAITENSPQVNGLNEVSELPGLQMHFRQDMPSVNNRGWRDAEVQKLGAADVPAMVLLTDIAFPGFFRKRTYQLGSYFGVFKNGQLVAMAGERIALPGMREISAVCTHPEHTGNGYATLLIEQLIRLHSKCGLRSFLHVAADNQRAVSLYQHLGFVTTASIQFRQIQRLAT